MWTVTNSTAKGKRYTATADGVPPVHFGSSQHENYTIHKDERRLANYLKRHAPTEDWEDLTTAGAWSRWLLWNKPTIEDSAKDMSRRFGVSIDVRALEPSQVQSVVFARPTWDVPRAVEWLIKHGFKYSNVDILPGQLRFRQRSPSKFRTYTTKPIKNNTISLIIGRR